MVILRTGQPLAASPQEVKAYMLSDQFKLEGFKGQALTFRTWDHQMRQPIILGGGTRVPVSTSPQEGFLHERISPTRLASTSQRPSANSANSPPRKPHVSTYPYRVARGGLDAHGVARFRHDHLRLQREGQHYHRDRRRHA